MSDSRFSLLGKRALLTGAAGTIGSALAIGLAEAGSDLALVELPGIEPSEDLAAALLATGRDIRWYYQDLAAGAELASFADRVWSDCGRVDILVNNAGRASLGRFNEIDYADWRRTMAVDLDAPFLLSQRIAEHMVHNSVAGRIIMISSKNGLVAEPGLLHYNAAKGGLELLARSLAVELGEFGITVNTVCPGMIESGLASDFPLDWERFVPYYQDHIPLEHRYARADEMVGPVVFLASSAGSYVTGHALVADGGVLANQVPRDAFLPAYRDRLGAAPGTSSQDRSDNDQ